MYQLELRNAGEKPDLFYPFMSGFVKLRLKTANYKGLRLLEMGR